jgi:hypothetical protein
MGGGLYLIGFWSTFDVDYLGLVDITEIPKNFILPFALTIAMNIILTVGFFAVFYSWSQDIEDGHSIVSPKLAKLFYLFRPRKMFINLDFLLIVSTIALAIGWLILSKWIIFLLVSGMLFVLFLAIKILRVVKIDSFKKRFAFITFFYLATSSLYNSFIMGKNKSINIYNNKEIKYIRNVTNNNAANIFATKDSASLKLVGFLGGKVIISDLDNKKIFILNQSDLTGIELEERKKK